MYTYVQSVTFVYVHEVVKRELTEIFAFMLCGWKRLEHSSSHFFLCYRQYKCPYAAKAD